MKNEVRKKLRSTQSGSDKIPMLSSTSIKLFDGYQCQTGEVANFII